MDINLIVLIISIVFVSTLTRSTFGFGDALIAMPLLALFIDIKIATPLIALIAFFIAILIKNWHKVEFKSAWRLIVASLIGIPIGLWYLDDIDENIIKLILGIIVFLFAVYNLARPKLIELKTEKYAWIFGFFAGILGGAYNTNGPPIVIYSSLKKWNPQNFRATLQGYFFTTGILLIMSHGIAGNFTNEVLTYFAYCLPVVLLAIILGARLNKKIDVERFHKYIYFILIILGIMLIVNSIK